MKRLHFEVTIHAPRQLDIDVDCSDDLEADFSDMWPRALARLKELCEQTK